MLNSKQPDDSCPDEAKSCWYSRHNLITIAFVAIISFYLITEHRAHLFGLLPWLILLACPLMHLFMHHGHGGHDHASHEENKNG